MNKYLEFNISIGQQKPESIINTETKCPFCDRSSLASIIDKDGDILLVKNKYPVLHDTLQTVLIETSECQSELSEYSKAHLYRLLRFGINHWLEMHDSGKYASVLFFKNHGPLSGGTIRHPHMQIIGLKNVDYHEYFAKSHFDGILIDRQDGVELNISTSPRIGFSEFNVLMLNNNDNIEQMADYIQATVHFLLNDFNKKCKSYNLFFYLIENLIHVKIVPRFPTSPIYIGYGIPQVSNQLTMTVEKFKNLYFHH